MLKVFNVVLASSDMSLDRVLNAGLPVAMLFYDQVLPAGLGQTMDDLARHYAGKVLIAKLARSDAPQAVSRFNIRQFPTLATVRDGKTVTTQNTVRPSDIGSHISYLLGEGPAPTSRAADTGPDSRREPGNGVLSVNEAGFEREVLRADRPVLIDFWAPWCAPCHMVAPAVEALAHDHVRELKVVKVNVDENPSLAGRYHAMSIPTMVIIVNGQEVDRWVGALPESAIRERVARWI